MDVLFTAEGLVALLTLTILEVVLGIDNLIFVGILAGKLPVDKQERARTIGLLGALIMRVVFLMLASWIAQLQDSLFSIPAILGMDAPFGVSGRDLIMFGGGMFLLYKATTELHDKLEGGPESTTGAKAATFGAVVSQIIALDLVFSIDSVITAIGLSQDITIMVIAVVASMIVMKLSARSITNFIAKHPTIKILALAFLLMVGLVLVAEGFHAHVPKGYVYFAMAFSVTVELLNLRYRSKLSTGAVQLKNRMSEDT